MKINRSRTHSHEGNVTTILPLIGFPLPKTSRLVIAKFKCSASPRSCGACAPSTW